MADRFIAFWNLENLFDTVDAPDRSDKLQRTLKNELEGWTDAVLSKKIAQLAKIIRQMNNGHGPDILGVCEVESRRVLEKLTGALADLDRNYRIAHADTQDHRGIDVAFIFDAELFSAEEQFSHFIVKRSATRDLFQVNFRDPGGRLLVLVGNHWPSRSGGRYESEPYRIVAGETLAYFHERIRQVHGDDVAVLAMGDFNDEPFDRSLVAHAIAERSPAKVSRARKASFLNLMWPVVGSGIGTHYFSNEPNVLDQFLVSPGLLDGASGYRVDTGSVAVQRFPEMVSDGTYPTPIRFGRGTSHNPGGFSDHFPVSVVVREL